MSIALAFDTSARDQQGMSHINETWIPTTEVQRAMAGDIEADAKVIYSRVGGMATTDASRADVLRRISKMRTALARLERGLRG